MYRKTSINYKVLTINTAVILLIMYFVVHSLSGERGLFAYFRLKKMLNEQTQVLKEVSEERASLESSTKHLHPKSLNIDMLDELARHELGLIGADEKVIYLEKGK